MLSEHYCAACKLVRGRPARGCGAEKAVRHNGAPAACVVGLRGLRWAAGAASGWGACRVS